jgi:predicted nucleic acid-binding protein
MYKICTIQNFSKEITMLAFSLREKYSLSFWDSIIVASALNANCAILASEDMQNGLKINNMSINNIFIEARKEI